jgi:hypothetical protein
VCSKLNKLVKVVVVIPIYKKEMTNNETISFKQCLKVLSKYEICIVSPSRLDLSNYINLLELNQSKYKLMFFDKKYFESITGYNNLLLRKFFYESFSSYDYMLIYQLDAFVFSDELVNWCNQNFDYIGAPWFENFRESKCNNNFEGVGNGGFSLRKISFFLKVFSWKFPLLRPSYLLKRYYNLDCFYIFVLKLPYIFLRIFGFRNTVKYFTENELFIEQEDVFWSQYMNNSWKSINLPSIGIACKFAFEQKPEYLFNLNNKKLPFGCHAWEKYDPIFWENYINGSFNE